MNARRFISFKLTLHGSRFNVLFALLAGISLVRCAGPAPSVTPTTIAPTQTLTVVATAAPTRSPGDSEHSVDVDGRDRAYVLYIPPGVSESAPASVVIVFHDIAFTVPQTRVTTNFDDLADSSAVVLVYPKGFGTSWNGGGCCSVAAEDKVDDVEFVQQVLADLESTINVDPNRIYAVGFGNGAMMAYRLACEMAETFAAIGAVQGPLFYEQCQPKNVVSLIHIHGLSNTWVPYAGGAGTQSGLPVFPPVELGIGKWVQWNGCSDAPDVNVNGPVTHTVYQACKSNTAVELYTVDGLEHSWPVTSDAGGINSTQIVWDFFMTHPKQ